MTPIYISQIDRLRPVGYALLFSLSLYLSSSSGFFEGLLFLSTALFRLQTATGVRMSCRRRSC